MSETVIVLHGIWMPSWIMSVLARRLRHCGYRVVLFGYRSLTRTVANNAKRLTEFIQMQGGATVHLVGHSLGGLVILQALQESPEIIKGRIVLLGSPVKGSAVADRMHHFPGMHWALGRSGENGLLGGGPVWSGHLQLGLIAGTRALGLGQVTGGLEGENDGTVTVAETRLQNASDSVEINVSHTGLVYAPEVASEVCNFLRDGHFSRR